MQWEPAPQPNTRRRHRCDSWTEPSPLVQCLGHWGRVRIGKSNQDLHGFSAAGIRGSPPMSTHVLSLPTVLAWGARMQTSY